MRLTETSVKCKTTREISELPIICIQTILIRIFKEINCFSLLPKQKISTSLFKHGYQYIYSVRNTPIRSIQSISNPDTLFNFNGSKNISWIISK